MSIIKKIKEAIIEFNAKRTLPDCVVYDYQYSYWVKCHTNESGSGFISEIDESEYKFKYAEYRQSKWGCWLKTGLFLFSDENIEILKRTEK